MNGGGYRSVRCREHLSTVLCKSKLRTQEVLRRSRAKANDDLGTDGRDLLLQPGATGCDFERVGLLMQPDFTARLPFKVLNRIGDVNHGSIDTGHFQALIKQLTGRPHKWSSYLIFAVARLFAYKKNCGMCSPLAEYYLGRVLVEIASVAMPGRLS